MARTLALLMGGLLLGSTGSAALAADVPYSILVDGRPVDAARQSGLNRKGFIYIDVVRAVKAFNGLLTFDRGGIVRLSLGGHTMVFRLGSKTATLDDGTVQLSGAPFRTLGDTYVPLAPVASLAGAKLTVDRQGHRAMLDLEAGEGMPAPAPTNS